MTILSVPDLDSQDPASSGGQRVPEPGHVTNLVLSYIGLKVDRGDWWGETIKRNRSFLWDFACNLPDRLTTDLSKVKRQHVQDWLDANPKHQPSYRRGRLSVVRGFFRWLHVEGRIPRDPTVGCVVADIPEGAPRSFTDSDVELLMAAAIVDARTHLCVCLCWNDGLRRVEVSRAVIEDIDFGTATMWVRGKFYRGKQSRRIALDAQTMTALRRYLTEVPCRTGSLIRSKKKPGEGVTPHCIGKIIEKAIRDAGLKLYPWDGRASHAGRHTSVVQSIEGGANTEHMKRQYGWVNDAMLKRYGAGAALDLHAGIHDLRAARKERITASL